MEEQNVLLSADVFEAPCPNLELPFAESSTKGEVASSLSADIIQTAHLLAVDSKERSAGEILFLDVEPLAFGTALTRPFTYISENQQFTGDKNGQHSASVSSYDAKRVVDGVNDETCIDGGLHADAGDDEALGDAHSQMQAETASDVHAVCFTSSQHINGGHKSEDAQQGNSQVNEDFRDNKELRGSAVMEQVTALNSDQQLTDFASVDKGIVPGDLVDSAEAGSVHDLVEFTMDEGCQGEASLEMLSGAVESFENMQRLSEEGLDSASKIDEAPGAVEEYLGNDFENVPVDAENHLTSANYGTLKSLMNKAMSESGDNGSTNAPREGFQHKDHFLNLLCELAAVQQHEHELSVMHSDQVASCATSLADNDAASSGSRRLSFVDLLRKQMVQAVAMTDLTADAFYEQFLRQNQAILGCSVGKDFNPSTASAGISSNDGAVAASEAEKNSNGNSDREGDTPSNGEIMGDCRNGEVKDDLDNLLAEGERSTGDDLKEERDEVKRFGVGDLVWAKVKSHPWWPGQIFNAADASAAAKKIQRPGRTLVAFFGDGTFGWLQQSQLIAFRPNFEEKVKQTTMKSFCKAVAEALDEVCRRMELGLRCLHSSDAMYSRDLFPDLNAGMRKGARIKRHQDITMSRERFQPIKVLEFVRTAACSPLFSLSSGLDCSDLCGHVYGFRNYMLSPKKPKSKIIQQNMVKVQKKVKSAQSSTLKRRSRLDETGDGPSARQGKEAKRLHLSKDTMLKEQHGGSRVQSPRFRSMENLLLTESDETKAPEAEVKSHEQAKGGTWLAKGKRLQISPDCKEAKRVKGWHSLELLGDPTDAGASAPADNSITPDDDTKTLFDITGLHSLKKKKKGGASKSTTDMVSKKVDQQPVEFRQECLFKNPLPKLEITGSEECSFPDSSTSSLSTVVPHFNLSVLPVAKEFDRAEESDKDKGSLLDSKIDDVEDSGTDKGELEDLKGGGAEESEKDKGELLDLKVGNAEESEKDKEDLLDLKVADAEVSEKELLDLKVGDAEKGEKDKVDLLDLKVGDAKESVKDKEEPLNLKESQSLLLEVINHDMILKGTKQTKHLHCQQGVTNGLLAKAKRRRQGTRDEEVEKRSSSSPNKKDVGSKKLFKSSKLGVSIKKVAGALKGTLKSADNFSAKKPISVTCVEFEGKKDKASNLGHGSPRNQVSALNNLDDENLNGSFAQLLNSLQVLARDPLSSANMKSSLHGVTSAFLKFRSMVFLKSSGYGAAGAGKLVSSASNGYSFGDKKVDNKGGSGKQQNWPSERQRPDVSGSFGDDRKAILKAEPPSESAGQGSQRRAVQGSLSAAKGAAEKRPRPLCSTLGNLISDVDSLSAGKTVAVKRHRPLSSTLGNLISDVQNSSDTETASGETPLCPKKMTSTGQKPGVQELAVAARKRKSEVLQECAAKVPVKSEALKGPLGKPLFKERVTDSRHHAKSVKHHISRAETLSLPEKKSLPIHNPPDAKVAQTSLGLFMQFAEDFTLPSEAQLKEMFTRFGTLETAGIRVYRNASTAQVVFKNSSDAEAAWQHAKTNRMFGHANVSYRLRHFSRSSKSDSKHFTPKNSFSEARDLKSSLVGNSGRPQHIRNSLSSGAEWGVSVVRAHSLPINSSSSTADSGAERGVSVIQALSLPINSSSSRADPGGSRVPPARSPVTTTLLSRAEPGCSILPVHSPVQNLPLSRAGPGSSIVQVSSPVRNLSSSGAEPMGSISPVHPSVLHQQGPSQSPSAHTVLFNSNLLSQPSVSNVNVSSGDIQDQMLKLLQQVSVIISSSSLTPKTN